MKLSIIIPIYNEEPQLKEVLQKVYAIPYVPREIILVDDFSSDGTRNLLQEYENLSGTAILYHEKNHGKGHAIRSGLKVATGDIVIIQDADLEYDPEDILKVIAPILRGECLVAYGSRFLGGLERMAIPNRFANWLLAHAASWLYWVKITDEATAYKAFHRSVLNEISLSCEGFEFCPEVTSKVLRLGYDIQEVSVSFRARTVWEGKKIGWPDFFIAMKTLLKCRFAPIEAIRADSPGKASST